ncbi:threonine dehydrogenase-like Zn-dependent dehydrogenase [Nocardioides zeae]|uniref:Threonine dehydrogenase-like Zn-dependent dehydrogenase n=1 Tax=Nocardioides zeae TaxID=1457234 RepID=A0ACC6IFQ4_9ACTN|nr:zinc-dependent alcohol dehydrogenase [Nocardioides zeae]MDR6176569.1 threonine dehydrogenase-like Zn-dependent dehydrogenase [Nocardioides zeae]MDR6209581.1 threonine dehydrogenase-like Zn-dependent dehydrogenase [Nocardioides zeae]
MRALTWQGVNQLSVETVPDPRIVNPHDVVLRVRRSAVCGSDLHFLGGYIPTMRAGDVIGHEFVGDVVEVGPEVTGVGVGDRVVVPSFIGCGACWHCSHDQWSLCDNSHPKPELSEVALGYPTGGIYGYTHAFGGYAGSSAEYVRVPYGATNCFVVPEGITDDQAVFVSDAAPTGWMGADFADIQPGDTVAVWGCGGVGLMAQNAARLMGAGRVIGIDLLPERLALAREIGSETVDLRDVDSLQETLRDLTGGRGPDSCIEAVGMEAQGRGLQGAYDKVKQAVRLETDRATPLREAVLACRKGGTVAVIGVWGLLDKFPMGAVMNKGLTVRSAQQHGQAYVPTLLEHVASGDLRTDLLATHVMPLEKGPEGYAMFKEKADGCVRAVFAP